jgi:predicted aldo/keto reductase-like oxidoreductase
MNADTKNIWPRSGLDVTVMGFGASPIGDLARPISEEDSTALIHAAWSAGIRYFDTAPMYGHGLSRLRKYRPTLLSHELDQNFQRGISHILEYGPVNFGFRTCL